MTELNRKWKYCIIYVRKMERFWTLGYLLCRMKIGFLQRLFSLFWNELVNLAYLLMNPGGILRSMIICLILVPVKQVCLWLASSGVKFNHISLPAFEKPMAWCPDHSNLPYTWHNLAVLLAVQVGRSRNKELLDANPAFCFFIKRCC